MSTASSPTKSGRSFRPFPTPAMTPPKGPLPLTPDEKKEDPNHQQNPSPAPSPINGTSATMSARSAHRRSEPLLSNGSEDRIDEHNRLGLSTSASPTVAESGSYSCSPSSPIRPYRHSPSWSSIDQQYLSASVSIAADEESSPSSSIGSVGNGQGSTEVTANDYLDFYSPHSDSSSSSSLASSASPYEGGCELFRLANRHLSSPPDDEVSNGSDETEVAAELRRMDQNGFRRHDFSDDHIGPSQPEAYQTLGSNGESFADDHMIPLPSSPLVRASNRQSCARQQDRHEVPQGNLEDRLAQAFSAIEQAEAALRQCKVALWDALAWREAAAPRTAVQQSEQGVQCEGHMVNGASEKCHAAVQTVQISHRSSTMDHRRGSAQSSRQQHHQAGEVVVSTGHRLTTGERTSCYKTFMESGSPSEPASSRSSTLGEAQDSRRDASVDRSSALEQLLSELSATSALTQEPYTSRDGPQEDSSDQGSEGHSSMDENVATMLSSPLGFSQLSSASPRPPDDGDSSGDGGDEDQGEDAIYTPGQALMYHHWPRCSSQGHDFEPQDSSTVASPSLHPHAQVVEGPDGDYFLNPDKIRFVNIPSPAFCTSPVDGLNQDEDIAWDCTSPRSSCTARKSKSSLSRISEEQEREVDEEDDEVADEDEIESDAGNDGQPEALSLVCDSDEQAARSTAEELNSLISDSTDQEAIEDLRECDVQVDGYRPLPSTPTRKTPTLQQQMGELTPMATTVLSSMINDQQAGSDYLSARPCAFSSILPSPLPYTPLSVASPEEFPLRSKLFLTTATVTRSSTSFLEQADSEADPEDSEGSNSGGAPNARWGSRSRWSSSTSNFDIPAEPTEVPTLPEQPMLPEPAVQKTALGGFCTTSSTNTDDQEHQLLLSQGRLASRKRWSAQLPKDIPSPDPDLLQRRRRGSARPLSPNGGSGLMYLTKTLSDEGHQRVRDDEPVQNRTWDPPRQAPKPPSGYNSSHPFAADLRINVEHANRFDDEELNLIPETTPSDLPPSSPPSDEAGESSPPAEQDPVRADLEAKSSDQGHELVSKAELEDPQRTPASPPLAATPFSPPPSRWIGRKLFNAVSRRHDRPMPSLASPLLGPLVVVSEGDNKSEVDSIHSTPPLTAATANRRRIFKRGSAIAERPSSNEGISPRDPFEFTEELKTPADPHRSHAEHLHPMCGSHSELKSPRLSLRQMASRLRQHSSPAPGSTFGSIGSPPLPAMSKSSSPAKQQAEADSTPPSSAFDSYWRESGAEGASSPTDREATLIVRRSQKPHTGESYLISPLGREWQSSTPYTPSSAASPYLAKIDSGASLAEIRATPTDTGTAEDHFVSARASLSEVMDGRPSSEASSLGSSMYSNPRGRFGGSLSVGHSPALMPSSKSGQRHHSNDSEGNATMSEAIEELLAVHTELGLLSSDHPSEERTDSERQDYSHRSLRHKKSRSSPLLAPSDFSRGSPPTASQKKRSRGGGKEPIAWEDMLTGRSPTLSPRTTGRSPTTSPTLKNCQQSDQEGAQARRRRRKDRRDDGAIARRSGMSSPSSDAGQPRDSLWTTLSTSTYLASVVDPSVVAGGENEAEMRAKGEAKTITLDD